MTAPTEAPLEPPADATPTSRRNPTATRRALLDATSSLLRERGESGVRVTEVARRAGTTTGAIYSHFRDRAELLAAAYVDRFAGEVAADIDALERVIMSATDRESTGAALLALTIVPDDEIRKERRWQRIEALAATRRHPGLIEQFAEQQRELDDRALRVCELARDAGFIAPDVELRSVTALIQAIPLGLVLADLDASRAPSAEGWLDLVARIGAAVAT